MNAEARRAGARVLLGAGLSPGISNMIGVRTAVGRFALEPSWAGRLASVLVRLGATEGRQATIHAAVGEHSGARSPLRRH